LFTFLFTWLILRCGRICCVANLKGCSAGHFACGVCLKEAAINAKKSGYAICCLLLLFVFQSLSHLPCLLGQSCANIIGFCFFVISFLYYGECLQFHRRFTAIKHGL
jgi:hypothetical protein